MAGFVADLRHGLRMLVRTPLLSVVAVLTVGLGVGGVTFGFSVMYATLYRGPPVRAAERLMLVMEARPEAGVERMRVPIHDYLDLRDAQRSFETLEGYYGGTVNLAGDDGPPERYQGAFVTAGLLEMLGVPAELGRTFAEDEGGAGAPPLVVLSHRVWVNRFGGERAALGRTVRVNGETAEIIGVMPDGFGFPMRQDLWVNIRTDPATLERRGGTGLQVVGRVREGVGARAAIEELAALGRRIEAAHPEENEGITVTAQPFTEASTPTQARMMVGLIMAMVLGVLLVACANVANVLMARAVVREREVAVRTALGAGRWRVVRQLLTEAAVLGVVGGVVGLGVAWTAITLLEASIQDIQRPYWIVFTLDAPVLLFTSVVTLAAAVGAGTWPALRASGAGVDGVLRDESRGSSSLRVSRLTSALVVGELAVSCGLMIAGGLTVRTLMELNRLDLGFDAERVMTARLGLFESDYPDAAARSRFYHELLDRLAAEPGVDAAAVTSVLPGTGQGGARVEVDGEVYDSPADRPRTGASWVSAGFFETMGMEPVEGRAFLRSESEREGQPVVVVSRSFVDRYMRGSGALGRQVRLGPDSPWLRVVGVVPDVHPGVGPFGSGGEPARDAIYLPLGQSDLAFASVAVRTSGPPAATTGALRRAVSAADPNLPLYWVRTLREAVDETASFHRIFGGLFAIVALAALFLSAVGLYGVIDFSVANRLRELGVRKAMGAHGGDVLRLVMSRVVRQLALGVLLGVAIGVGLAVPLAATLYGVDVWDPLVYGGIAAVLTATGLAAAMVPALRAVRVDPVVALRV
ncbi:MAG: ABC transporter permease [Gemmatimonadetes bacterium]|nr:ABC transporter permease [Gemmatimonadota bacterium]